ncbi:Mitochondrial import inner membrane translocase subunit tim50 [Diplonema papillatum]|nr:Mitochondrial import inner membrane translocase subunit tim50 [Diplonema papillatum]
MPCLVPGLGSGAGEGERRKSSYPSDDIEVSLRVLQGVTGGACSSVLPSYCVYGCGGAGAEPRAEPSFCFGGIGGTHDGYPAELDLHERESHEEDEDDEDDIRGDESFGSHDDARLVSPGPGDRRLGGALPGLLLPERPEGDRRLCVVLDLDETLISNHSQYTCYDDDQIVTRPHLQTLLCTLSSYCEVVLWTASTEEVTNHVLSHIDPFGIYFEHVIARSPQWFRGVPYTKDLMMLGRPLSRTIIIENNSECVARNRSNAILVSDFTGQRSPTPDLALLVVLEIIDEISYTSCPLHEVIAKSSTLTHRFIDGSSEAIHQVPQQCKPINIPVG